MSYLLAFTVGVVASLLFRYADSAYRRRVRREQMTAIVERAIRKQRAS